MADEATSPLMGRIIAHHKSLVVKTIIVPEWGESDDKPLIIYGMPMTVQKRQAIFKEAASNTVYIWLEAIIALAAHADGKPMFSIADRPMLLRRADPDVVERIGNELLKPSNSEKAFPTDEDRLKN